MAYTYKNAAKARNPRVTPQTEIIPGREQDMAKNNAGGVSFVVSPWTKLDRFLVLGTEGGTYYVNETKLTEDNAKSIISLIEHEGSKVVDRIVDISHTGRAPKNDPALFALALAMTYGDDATKAAAYAALPKVARIGTHVLHLASYADSMRGWGRGMRRAFGEWYTNQKPTGLAMNLVKYANRDGWTHRDILRLAHPKADGVYQQLLAYAADKPYKFAGTEVGDFMDAVLTVKNSKDVELVSQLIHDSKLPREVVPTELLSESLVWEALLPHMGTTALVRNLATLTRVGLIAPQNDITKLIISKLRDEEEMKKARLHPVAVLAALLTYRAGHSARGSNTWTPVTSITDELDELFYRSFGLVIPTGKRLVIALDVSGSMAGGEVAGVPGLSPRVASAALAMLAARTEIDAIFLAFASNNWGNGYLARTKKFNPSNVEGITTVDISKKHRLDTVCDDINGMPFGGTDCALPMIWAGKNDVKADQFQVLTDSETWSGPIHPTQALKQYRDASGIPAQLVVVGMTATDFSIADPKDAGMLDVVGFDTATPNIISDFARNGI